MLKLILPVLFPSWRFFSSIGPSPRIEVGFVAGKNAEPLSWLSFRTLPEKVGLVSGLLRLFHNPQWNEHLYINTCAEHLFENHSEFYELEIARRLLVAINSGELVITDEAGYFVFRIRALEFDAGQLRDDVVFVSPPFALGLAGVKQ